MRGVVERVDPPIEGVTFTPVRGPAAQVHVRNRTGEDLEILDGGGKPFLRIGPRGVFGNEASAAWYASGNPDGRGSPSARTGDRPRWTLVSRGSDWSYYEHRLHPSRVRLPPEARGARRPIRLLDFTVPVRHGGRPATVRGRLEFRPVLGRATPRLLTTPAPVAGVTVAVLPGEVPGLLLQNRSRTPVTVIGPEGEPYARVGPGGVEVNQRSPLHVDELRVRGILPRVAADARARPAWRRVKKVPSFSWTEPRARYALEQPPDEIVREERPVRLKTWTVPIRAGDRTVELRGTTTWVPTGPSGLAVDASAGSDDDGGRGWLLPVALVMVLGAVGIGTIFVLRARAQRGGN